MKRVKKIIHLLDIVRRENPEQTVVIELPQRSVQIQLGDAIIYEGASGEIVIDGE